MLVLVLVLVVVVVLLLLLLPCSPSCSSGCRCRAFLVLLLLVAAPHVLNPHVSFEREIVFRNTSSCLFPLRSLFKQKALLCLLHKERKAGRKEDARSRRPVVRAFADEKKSAGVVDAKPI